MQLTLVDTSVWIDALRKNPNKSEHRTILEKHLVDGTAAWCPVIQLELSCGFSSESDRKYLGKIQSVVQSLEISDEVWRLSYHIASTARAKGITAPVSDILIFACSQHHKTLMLHNDKHFTLLEKLFPR